MNVALTDEQAALLLKELDRIIEDDVLARILGLPTPEKAF